MDSIKGLIEKLTDLANSDYARSAEGGRYYMGRSDGFSKAIAEVRDFFAASPAAPEPERGEGGGDPDWEAKEIRRRIDENKAICQQPIASGIEGGVGYRWVKCSERFPDFPFIRMMVLREIKQPFNKAVTNFSFDFQYNKVHFGKTAFNPEDVEWLEEYELFPQPTTSGEEKEFTRSDVKEIVLSVSDDPGLSNLSINDWVDRFFPPAKSAVAEEKDLSDTNVGNIVQRAENQVTGNDVEGEAPEDGAMAAILDWEVRAKVAIGNGEATASSVLCEAVNRLLSHYRYMKKTANKFDDRLSAASTRISELQRELSLEIDTRKVLSDQLAAEKSFNENSRALEEKNGMEAEGLRLSIRNLRDAFREQGLTGVADRIGGLLTK